MWKLNQSQCQYRLNKKLSLKPIKNTKFQVDENQQVVLQRKNMVSTDNRCPNMKLFATEYDNLFLTTDVKVTFKMVDDVDFITLLNSKLEYSFFISEKEIMKQNTLNSINTCKMRLKLEQKEEVDFGNGTFLSRRGDIIIIMSQCIEKEVKIKPSCHEDVQLEDSCFEGIN